MFEESLIPPKKDGPSSRDKAVGILVTVLVHALLGVLIYHGRFTVKILPFGKEEVRTVLIVPPLKVAIPKVVGGRGLSEVPGGPQEAAGAGRAARQPEEARQEPEPAPVEPRRGGSCRTAGRRRRSSLRPVRARSSLPCRRVSSSRSRYTASPI